MRIAFRADASIEIGTGHVMRCLSLADMLAAKGARCEFICREHPGHLIEHIRGKGYAVHILPMRSETDTDLAHSHWLGATQEQEAQVCALFLAQRKPDWLIVDHYALDARWESAMDRLCGQVMVIDDLVDRTHNCDLLLDQNYGRAADDYRALVPPNCQLLCGSSYALLRLEFAALRSYSLQRRAQPQMHHLLVTMGGIDKKNATGQVLAALRDCALPAGCEITVVMGATAPWRVEVERQARTMPWPTWVQVGVSNMAQLMADSDLAIGAAGATAWELCCLGVPMIMLVLASNQSAVGQGLERAGAARLIEQEQDILKRIPALLVPLLASSVELALMSEAARAIVDGRGVNRLMALLEG